MRTSKLVPELPVILFNIPALIFHVTAVDRICKQGLEGGMARLGVSQLHLQHWQGCSSSNAVIPRPEAHRYRRRLPAVSPSAAAGPPAAETTAVVAARQQVVLAHSSVHNSMACLPSDCDISAADIKAAGGGS
jgi:hypothetical protein